MNAVSTAPIPKRPALLALVIKDYGLCKPVIIAGLVSLFLPVFAVFMTRLFTDGLPHGVHTEDVIRFRLLLAEMMIAGLLLACSTLPALAATALARERRERSGDFLRTLPIARSKIVLSKALIVLGCTLLLVVIALVAAELIRPAMPNFWPGPSYYAEFLIIPAMMIALIGLGWGLGSIMRSDTIAAAISLGVVITFFVGIWMSAGRFYGDLGTEAQERAAFTMIAWAYAITGLIGIIAGTVIAIRRTSP